MSEYVERIALHHPGEHGSRVELSWISEVLHYDKILEAVSEKKYVDVIFEDFAKVFGKCDRDVAHTLGIKGILDK